VTFARSLGMACLTWMLACALHAAQTLPDSTAAEPNPAASTLEEAGEANETEESPLPEAPVTLADPVLHVVWNMRLDARGNAEFTYDVRVASATALGAETKSGWRALAKKALLDALAPTWLSSLEEAPLARPESVYAAKGQLAGLARPGTSGIWAPLTPPGLKPQRPSSGLEQAYRQELPGVGDVVHQITWELPIEATLVDEDARAYVLRRVAPRYTPWLAAAILTTLAGFFCVIVALSLPGPVTREHPGTLRAHR
jgi:hypothetical protein